MKFHNATWANADLKNLANKEQACERFALRTSRMLEISISQPSSY